MRGRPLKWSRCEECGRLFCGGAFPNCSAGEAGAVLQPSKQVPLYLTQDEQLERLGQAGFGELEVLHDEGGMRLISARRR
jgi:hypothetical protein